MHSRRMVLLNVGTAEAGLRRRRHLQIVRPARVDSLLRTPLAHHPAPPSITSPRRLSPKLTSPSLALHLITIPLPSPHRPYH
eukprot:8154913-Pyramimonas_sp.AAC.1